jgi:hypothetical protein
VREKGVGEIDGVVGRGEGVEELLRGGETKVSSQLRK